MYELTIKRVENGTAADAGSVQVDPAALGGRVRSRLVHKACVMYQANKRRGTHSTKTRGEVHYSNKKPWKQKGTGRARAGTRRSPLWRGGGTIFGPKPRDYSYAMPKKARRRATQSALHSKFRDDEAVVIEAFPETGKTRDLAALLKGLAITERALLVTHGRSDKLTLAARNLKDAALRSVEDLNAFDLVFYKRLVITKAALDAALERFGVEALGGAIEAEAEAEEV